jgi:Natural resistance-associated macrophage protein
MKRVLGVTLGILTAIGGFLDIGDMVTNAVVGSRFGLSLGWVVVVGVIGICVFAQMSGRVAAVSGRATFELIRERLGPRVAVGLACHLASQVLGHGERRRPGRALPDRLRGGTLPASARLGRAGTTSRSRHVDCY